MPFCLESKDIILHIHCMVINSRTFTSDPILTSNTQFIFKSPVVPKLSFIASNFLSVPYSIWDHKLHLGFLFFFFWCWPFLKSLLNLLQCCFCFLFWVFGHVPCGIPAPPLGMEPAPAALEGEVLAAGPPGKFMPLVLMSFLVSFSLAQSLSLSLCFMNLTFWIDRRPLLSSFVTMSRIGFVRHFLVIRFW